jgi:hypothetical protein
MRFLRYTNFNAAAAAQSIVLYWKRRREVFGDRVFLPLTLTGDGALSNDDIEFINTGYIVFLPNDADGRTVVCTDYSRRLDHSLDTRLRCTFYQGQILSENEKSQTDGWVLLAILNDGSLIDPATKKCRNLLFHTFPVKLKAFHVIKCMPMNWANNCLAQAFISGMVQTYGYLLQGCQAYLHYSQDKEKIVQSLASHGMSRCGLPRLLGGSWSYERFSYWRIERAQMDRQRQPDSSFPATQTASGVAAALPTSKTTSDDDDCKPRSTEPSDDAGLDNAPATASPTGRAAYLVATDGDDSKPRSIQPCDAEKREEMYQNFRKQVMQATEQLPQDEKASYIEALEMAPPQVWKEESNPDVFLCVEDFHARFAARRICKYWQLRSETFGLKRFQPLSMTGEGALEARELKVLQNDSIMLLPKDAHGCPVLSIDGSCLEKRRDCIEYRDRCIFYMFSLLAEDEVSQTEGAVLLCKMDSPPFHSLDAAFLERLANSLPLRFKAVHLLSREPIPNDVKSQINFADETYVHVGSSNDELASQLEEFGLNKAGLPKYLNGKWGLSKFLHWKELRTRMEWRIPLGFSGRDRSEAFDLPAIKPYTLLPHEEKADRDRRLNVIHCRRKRDLIRVELGNLEEECAELRETREGLVEEHSRLEDLMKVAIETVERVEGGEQCVTANQFGRLSAQTAEHGSSRSTGDTLPVHPVTAYEQVSTGNAVSASSMGQPNPPLQGKSGGRTQALQPKAEWDHVLLGPGVGPLRQAPAVLPASLGSRNAQVETSSPLLSSVTRLEQPAPLLAAAQGLLNLWSQS